MHASAVDALIRSLAGADVRVTENDPPGLVLPDGRSLPIQVVTVAVLDEARANRLVRESVPLTVVVADLITATAREVLAKAGLGWLDRRGHLHIAAPGLLIDRTTDPLPRITGSGARPAGIRGTASTGVAAAQLIWGPSSGVRQLARMLGRSPAAVSKARSELDRAGLLDTGPDARRALFWLLSDSWHPEWTDLPIAPRAMVDDLAASGTRAAAALGAPIISTADYPIELYAPGVTVFERARLLATPPEPGPASRRVRARIAVAPTGLVTTPDLRSWATIRGWLVTHPLFVALDLAADPARGQEALEDWDPPGWHRAW